ncbi:FIST signal transduction protein [Roseicyclus mahoneyensis]|uniref:Small ligand-binding sensory domain FIST n=1 Tax=Roseicyclus mahoneyensis TaxID=164332 RepID=A0A316GBW1_9RHOB|nr:FIST N-terminal domain-containing protein [Roseicyclus mahoneyensis]PWK58122.1 hypothetical protein C7455_11063 [Roseicyclus mahoneyensis]
MDIVTAQSRESHVAQGVAEIVTRLDLPRRGRPDFVAVHFGVGLHAAKLRDALLGSLGAGALHGGSSCLGVMGRDGVDIAGAGLGAFAIWDAEGSYGTGAADLGENAEEAARHAALAALAQAGRSGEMPDMVWLSVAPGREEQVLAGLRAVVGAETLIVGGSSADNDISGSWAQFGPDGVHGDGVVVSVLFPSQPIASVYQSGYAPTGAQGHVTRVEGRRLIEIDGRPAAQVLHDWSGGVVPMAGQEPCSILAASTLWPLGRVTRHLAGVPFHLLAHPAVAHPDGSVDLFADVAQGDHLWQMQGSADSLVARAGRVAAQARESAGGAVAGALVVYCGGCMLAVRDRMEEVSAGIEAALGDVPWLGVFTFGEQGVPVGDEAKHGNLMISCSVIAQPDP